MKIKFVDLLKEEYVDSKKSSYMKTGTIDIFKNPTPKELRDCNVGKNMRFLADMDTNTIYCWDGEYGIHNDVIKYLQTKFRILKDCTTSSHWFNHCEYLDKYIPANIESGSRFYCDTYEWIETECDGRAEDYLDEMKEGYQNLEKLLKKDFSWLSKYKIDPQDAKRMAQSCAAFILNQIEDLVPVEPKSKSSKSKKHPLDD